MNRTSDRPIPSGRIAPRDALYFSSALSVLGLVHLVAFVNVLTAFLVALTLVSYIFVYTPLKRRTWLATLVGAVPGALPILAGWTAAGAGLTARASRCSPSCSSGRCRTSTRWRGCTGTTTPGAAST
jgi:heme o synthase